MNELNKETIVGVIGAGTMGSGITQVAAVCGHKVILYDFSFDALNKAKSRLSKVFVRLVEKEKYTQQEANEILNRINYESSFDELKQCGFVVEAIIEDLKIKEKFKLYLGS